MTNTHAQKQSLDSGSSNTVGSGQINPDWDCLQANHMSTSFKTDNLICSLYCGLWINNRTPEGFEVSLN
jgi:hypothetical protein